MPQHSLLDDGPPVVSLIIEIDDETLLSCADATTVTLRTKDSRGDTAFCCKATLVGLQQDLLWTLLEAAVVAWRYGTPLDVRKAVREAQAAARAHVRAMERE